MFTEQFEDISLSWWMRDSGRSLRQLLTLHPQSGGRGMTAGAMQLFLFISLVPKPIEAPSQTSLQGHFFSDARLGQDDDIKHHI